MNPTRIQDKLHLFWISVFSASVFFALLLGACFCQPSCEDLSLSLQARELGLKASIANTLVDFDGRYFTNFLHAFNPLVINSVSSYKFMPVIGVSLFSLSILFFLDVFFKKGQLSALLLITLLFSALYFSLNPSLSTGVYLMISSFVYLWAWSFTLLWMGACLRYFSAVSPVAQFIWFIASAFLLFCAIGINEMFLPVIFLQLAALVVWSFTQKNFLKVFPLALLGLCCMFFFVTSPGILNRVASNQSNEAGFIYYPNILQSIIDFTSISIGLLKNGILFAAVIAAYPFISKLKWNDNILSSSSFSKIHILSFSLFLLLIAYGMTLSFYIPMQKESGIPYRIFSSTAVLQILGFGGLFYVVCSYMLNLIQQLSIAKLIPFTFSVILLASLFFSENNFTALIKEYRSGSFQTFDKNMNHRFQQLNQASNSNRCYKSVALEPITNYPETIFYVTDILPNRSFSTWNLALETYFKLDEVRLKGDTTGKYRAEDFLIAAEAP